MWILLEDPQRVPKIAAVGFDNAERKSLTAVSM